MKNPYTPSATFLLHVAVVLAGTASAASVSSPALLESLQSPAPFRLVVPYVSVRVPAVLASR